MSADRGKGRQIPTMATAATEPCRRRPPMTNRTTRTVAAVIALAAAVVCAAATGASAITTKPSATAVIRTTLQISPPADDKTTAKPENRQQVHQPSFAARYWQRDIGNGPSLLHVDDDDYSVQQPPHKLSAVQQTHILDDIRRHNQEQQWWTAPGTASTVPSSTANIPMEDSGDQHQDSAVDQLQQLLQINGVAADDDDAAADNPEDDRHGKQRSIGGGGGAVVGWQPQSPQQYNNHNRQQQPSLSPPVTTVSYSHQHSQNQQQQQQYYPTTLAGPTIQQQQQHHQHYVHRPQKQQQQQQQQQQIFVTTPPSSVVSTTSINNQHRHVHQHQQYIPLQGVQPVQQPQPQYYPQPQPPALQVPVAANIGDSDNDDQRGGGGLDADIEQQIRQQLTAVVGAGGGNYTVLTSAGGDGGVNHRLTQHFTGSASNDNAQYVKIGGGGSGTGSSPSRNRLQQQQDTSAIFAGAASPNVGGTVNTASGGRNTIVKTVVIRQKPQPAAAPPAVSPPAAPVMSAAPSQPWTVSEQQQLEQLARQVLPPGVAQYEIIRAGGVDGGAAAKNGGDAATAATVDSGAAYAEQQAVAAGGKKKPVTFVILEERPDGTVRVRGIEKKQHGGAPSDGSDAAADVAGTSAVADDEQLQQLVDKLNRGELRLPSGGSPTPSSKTSAQDSAAVASTTASTPLPAYVSPFPSTVQPQSTLVTGGIGVSTNKRREPAPTSYFPTKAPQTTTTALHQHQYQNFFLPTAVPTEAVAVATTTGQQQQQQQNKYHHHQHQHQQQHQQQQQQFYTPPTITTSASYTTPLVNSTLSYFNNNNNNNNNNKAVKEGMFSGALRRRGYYAMAKYMRQAGVDAVLEETGPFTVFVPTDKAFRALLVQLGGPDRAEDKFRENPRLLIGLLLHHVVPGAFRASDLMAGDEMTGVSLAGTQLRANLYARQLYDNRWNDIEVLTVNGARVLDDVNPTASSAVNDGSTSDDGSAGPTQQRRDMVLSSSGSGGGSNQQQIMAIGHAVDRVLFPLPVGDVLATMRADRQRRYNVFLRAVDEHCSPTVRSLLTGSRTVTVFAPVDEAFRVRRGSGNYSTSSSSGSIIDWMLHEDTSSRFKKRNRRRIADRFVLSHVVLAGPGDPPMYTAGLRFYQVRDTAYRLPEAGDSAAAAEEDDEGAAEDFNGAVDDGNLTVSPNDGEKSRFYQLTVYKDSGRIRLNGGAAQVLVRNVPATNGVLHGLDAPLV
ncbi:uncharacterized protein LOC111032991 isoform X2 [Myzus persicae]|uniref:uncharacterized protein LOC111032991 isoform X2 n=1 Tax=Myzus persicae TaxID=13164 RepID=UPI000B935746|nr:uncharacterized protein LOC111032991 isoform X2 [Myzus persicae]